MIILHKGKRGAGKTLTMLKDGLYYMREGYRILRNFEAQFGEYISNDGILLLDKNSAYHDCVLMIDEIQMFFDARRSGKQQNLDFSNFIQQIRKRHIIILATTQYSNNVDLRFRQHVDIIVYPNYIKELELCEASYVDISSMDDVFSVNKNYPTFKIIFDPKRLFRLYNTDQMIK